MPTPKLAVAADVVRGAAVQRGMAQVRVELEVPNGFPDAVLAAADQAAKANAWRRDGRPDRTAVELGAQGSRPRGPARRSRGRVMASGWRGVAVGRVSRR